MRKSIAVIFFSLMFFGCMGCSIETGGTTATEVVDAGSDVTNDVIEYREVYSSDVLQFDAGNHDPDIQPEPTPEPEWTYPFHCTEVFYHKPEADNLRLELFQEITDLENRMIICIYEDDKGNKYDYICDDILNHVYCDTIERR